MASHRKNSSKKRMRAGELAVAAFLGLAVTAAPAVAAADTTDGPSTGPSSDNDSKGADSKGADGSTSSGPGAPSSGTGSNASGSDNDSDDADDTDDADETGADDAEGDGGISGADSGDDEIVDDADEDAGEGDVGGDGAGGDDATTSGGDGSAGTGDTGGIGTEVVEPEPEIVDPPVVEPEVVQPETPPPGIETDNAPVVAPVVVPEIAHSAQFATLSGSDPTPTPPALASALIDIDIVPEPPTIPAFAPFMGVINALANWVDQIFPPYQADPILNPTQVAAGWVMTLFAGLQGTYWNGQPTPFTFGALVLVTAAYQRYERLATNQLPGAPTVSAGPLPLTWKLKSVDPDGDPLIYSVDLNGQPSNGLITMSPDGTFSFVPNSLDDLNNGTDVTFTVRVNDSLGFLEHPLTPDGNDAFYTVTFRYPGLGINNLPVFNPSGQAQVSGYDPVTGKVTIIAQATDADGDPLTYTATSLWGNIVRNEDGTFTYTPTDFARHAAASLLGAKTDLVTIWANDGRGGITLLPTMVSVDIISANTPPTITVGTANTEPITGIITGSFDVKDDDGDLVIVTGDVITSRGGIVVVTPLGYAYTPTLLARSQGGTDTFTVTLNDAHGGVVEVAVTVTINRINTNPIGGITTGTRDADGVVRGTVAATDFDGDDLSFTLAGGASSGYSSSGGIVLLNSNGTFTFIPKPGGLLGDLTLDSFEVNISDGRGGTATTTVTLFANLKVDPVVTSNVDGVIKGGLDIDDDDNTGLLTYGVGNGPTKGTVTVNPDGTYTYTATTAGWNESDTFTIVGTVDGKSITIATVTVVPKPNVAPTAPALDGAVVVGGSGIASGNIGASDANGDTLHYSVDGYGGASTKVLANGAIVTVDQNGKWHYIPGLNSGTLGVILASSFTVYISDGKGGQASTLVTVSTHDLAIPVTKVGSNGTVTGGLGLTAGEQGLMTYSLGTGPGKGTVTVNPDGTYTYTATTAGWNESDTFTIMGTVGGQTIAVAEVSVVPKSNAAPTVDPLDLVTVIGGSGIATGNVGANDANGDTLHYSVTGYGGASTKVLSNGAIVSVDANGKWSYIPGLNSGVLGAIIASTFTVYVSDGKGGQVSTPVVVTTHDLSIPVTKVGSNGTVTGGLTLTAAEQGLMTYSVGNGPTKGTVTVNPDGTYTYTATTAGWNESDTFTIVGTIGGQTITVANVSLVPKVNSTPTSKGIDGAVIVGGSGIATGNVDADDDDNDTLHYSVIGYGGGSSKVLGNGSIVTVDANGKWSYVPGQNSGVLGAIVGSTFTVYVTDGKGGQTTTLVTVTTHDLDLTVTKTNGGHGVTTGAVQLTSNEQGVLTYSVGSGPSKGTVTVNPDGTYTYNRTAAGHTGGATDTFEIMGTVGGVSIVVATVTVTPTLSNAAPTAGTTTITESSLGISILGLRTQSSKGKVTAFDADGDAVTYPGGSILPAMYGTANGGSISFYSDGTFTYSITKTNSYFHAAAANGATGLAVNDTFSITVTDALGASSTIVVSVPVEKLNAGPSSTVSTNASSDALGVVRGTLNGSDDDDDTLTYSLIGLNGGSAYTTNGGIVTLAGNSFTYIPTKSGSTTDTFQVTVSDGHGGTATATVSVAQATPSPVTITNPANNVQKITLNAPANDAALLTFSVGTQGAKGTVVRNADGTYTYTRNAALGHSTTPNDSFTIVGTDASGKSVTIATVNVAPTIPNAAPVGGSVTITSSSLEDNTVLGIGTWKQRTSGSLAASDADGDSVSWLSGTFSTTNGGSVVVNANGTWSYSIDKSYSYFHDAAKVGASGTAFADNFSVTVVDAFGGSTSYSVNVNIYAHNEPPSISGGTRVVFSNNWIGVWGTGSNGDSVNTSITAQTGGGSASFNSTLGTLNTSGKSGGNTITLTATETEYYRVVNGVVQVGTLSSTSRTFTV